jgi:hypothetical protein
MDGVHIRMFPALRHSPGHSPAAFLESWRGLAGQVALVVILALASFSVQEMKPGAGGANDAFIFVFLERHRLRPTNVGRSSMSSGR